VQISQPISVYNIQFLVVFTTYTQRYVSKLTTQTENSFDCTRIN